jgi:hypothetical protein
MQANGSGSYNLFRQFFQPAFVLSLGVLLFAAFGIHPAMAFLSEKFSKSPIELRKPLDTFTASRMPSFASGYTYQTTQLDSIALGTDRYLCLNVIPDNRQGFCLARLIVSYYSNQQDKVPHTPEVCYRQIGAVIKQLSTIALETPELGPVQPTIPVCLVRAGFKDRDEISIYCFYVEGKFRSDRTQARLIIGMPGNKHTYFSKIEACAVLSTDSDPAQAITICKKLLQEALPPLVNEYFPTADQLKRN